MELGKIKAFLTTISLPVRLVVFINGKRDSFLFDGKNYPEGLESVYLSDYQCDNEYHKQKFDEYIEGFTSVEEKKEEPIVEAPRRGRPPKKSMEETLSEG